MSNTNMYVGLDIGTTSIKVIVAEDVKGQLNVIGYGNVRSKGLSRGVIVDIDQVVGAMKEAIKDAEEKVDVSIDEVIVGIPANMLQIEQCRGMITLSDNNNRSREITEDDVRAVVQAAMTQSLPPERAVIDVVPDEFIIDDYSVTDPREMQGMRLEMKGVLYTGSATIIHNIRKSVEKAGVRINEIVVAPVASAQVALSEDERNFGSILIDLGSGQTTAAVIHDHKLKYTYVDQEGGNYITRDISVVLNTSPANAERLKTTYGYALASMAETEESFSVQVVGQQEPEMITEEYLAQIIEARLRQIFGKIYQALDGINALSMPGGIVLTGGGADIWGIKELAEEIFGVRVKIYRPEEMGLRTPTFTQVIGLIEYGVRQSEINHLVRSVVHNTSYRPNIKSEPVDDSNQELVHYQEEPEVDYVASPVDEEFQVIDDDRPAKKSIRDWGFFKWFSELFK